MRSASKLTLRSLLFGIAATVVVPTSAYCSLFEVSAASIVQDPYVLCGRIESRLGGETVVASGGLATSNAVLTSAEAVWNAEDGFSTRVLFQRARRGSSIANTTRGTFIVLLSKYASSTDSSTKIATNVAGVLFRKAPAGGRHLNLKVTRQKLSTDEHNYIVGYVSSLGNGKRMGTYSGVSFSRVSGTPLHRPSTPSKVDELTKGGPVFHFVPVTTPGASSVSDFVGVVVDRGFIRGFTSREVSEIGGFGR